MKPDHASHLPHTQNNSAAKHVASPSAQTPYDAGTTNPLLRGNERTLVNMLKDNRIAVWHYDIAGGVMSVSPEYLQLFRYTPEKQLTWDDILERFVHEEDKAIARENMHQAIGFGSSFHHVVKMIDANNKTRRILCLGFVNSDTNNVPKSVIGLMFDMTENKRDHLERKEGDARYRMLFELQNDATYLIENAKVVVCNHKMLEMFRAKDPNDLIGLTPWDISPAVQSDGQTSREKSLSLIRQNEVGKLRPFVWSHRRLDGTEFYAHVSPTPIIFQGKKMHLVLLRDVTEEYQLRSAVEENQAYLQVLAEMRRSTFRRNEMEIISAFLASVTEHFDFAKTWFGHFDNDSQTIIPTIHHGPTSHVVDGTSFTLSLSKTEEVAFPACSAVMTRNCCVIDDLSNSGDFLNWRQVALKGDFHSLIALPLEVNIHLEGAFVLYSKHSSISRNVVEYLQAGVEELARILSERRLWEEQKRLMKRSKEKAEMTAEAKSRFLANMSHEIRTSMTAILGFTEALADQDISRQRIDEIAQIIRTNSDDLLHILNDILDYSKIEAEMLKIEMSSFSLENLLSEIHSIFSAVAAEKCLDFVIKNTTHYPAEILSDRFRLKQIMLNLVGNAFKFTDQGKVEIIVSWMGDRNTGFGQLRLDVNDTGKGISDTALETIFTLFEQEDDSPTCRYEGAGLGLAISRKLIRLLCGNLTVVSTPGMGSCFSVLLPQQVLPTTVWNTTICEGTEMNTQQYTPEVKLISRPLEGCRILLVEDGVDNQRLFSLILKKAGAVITTAVNGQEGVNAVERSLEAGKPFDVILMDMQMPVMDGLTATRTLREKGIAIPIVALTARAMQEEQDKCHEAGCNVFLSKPIHRDALLSTVANIISQPDMS